MTSSSEIHVQEVLNSLSKSIKSDGMEKIELDESFTAVIAQAQAQAQAEAQAQAQAPAQNTQEQHDQHQVNQDELERIAQEHQQHQQQLALKHEQVASSPPLDNLEQQSTSAPPIDESTVITLESGNSSTLATVPLTPTTSAPQAAKPVAGSEEWHKMRRDNHKEVERRRRETINAGINDLAAVIPNPDKNKGAILRQAVKFIESIQEAHQKALAENEALTAVQIERENALLQKNLAQTQLQMLIAEHEQLKRDFDSLRKEADELEESKKRQRTD
ncbi:basic helix-loop-helix protein [Dissophora globulifera]|uniref:Basic helix-loop-helix protein n=1 Tax=Dissophora globulifera TaxID=979702 RepID=A0A9P6RUH5_9FUNG|nr:basic helix-loop-helix protein [Dissophora globulifera]KAG0329404.1 basic helix-loop-helix protein [Dissophora globulifera]